MNQFDYKGKTVQVFNDGGSVEVNFIERNTPDPVRRISGNRVEFPYGGGKWIYHVFGSLFDEVDGNNRIQAQALFVITLEDGTKEVVQKRDVGFSVRPTYLDMIGNAIITGLSTYQWLRIHFVNAILARIPELGGDSQGRGLEIFNNDGSVDTPLFTYTKDAEGAIEILPVQPAAIGSKLLVDGVENEGLIVSGLTEGLHQFTYQEVDSVGAVTAAQTRNILV